MSIPEITSWRLESIRLTVFLAEPPPSEQSWWLSVTGQEPETSVIKRQTGEQVEEGVFSDWKLSLNINSLENKIDWIAYPPNPSPSGISSIGQYTEQSDKFCNALNSWLLEQCPSVVRIAYGAVLINEVPDRTAGYKMLEFCLPIIKFNIDNWSDFLFQVNKKGKSNVVEGLALNQLSKWGVLRMVRLSLGKASVSPVEFHACRLELDINTDGENRDPIAPDRLSLILSELKETADCFASEGFRT